MKLTNEEIIEKVFSEIFGNIRLNRDLDFVKVRKTINQALSLKDKQVKEVIKEWLNDYCTHGKDNCLECIEELKSKLFGKEGEE